MQTWPNFGYTVAYSGGGGGGGSSLITPATLSVGSGSVSRISGVAPLSVFFDASATVAPARTSKPFHELEYRWTYGDPAGGATWTYGARANLSKNVSYGPEGSHVFETPGTYVVTLDVRDVDSGGIVDNATPQTITITVSDPDTVFSTTNTIVFATDGVFTGKPTGAQEVTTSDYATAINTYKATGKRLLFKKGQTFTASGATASLDVDGPGIIGAWGTGAAPKFSVPNSYKCITLSSATTPGINDWRVMDIEMDGQNGASYDTGGLHGSGGINQFLALRLNIHNIGRGIAMSKDILDYNNANGDPGHTIFDEFAVVDCRINTIMNGVPTGSGIGAYINSARLTLMGNTIDVAGGGEHVLRTPYVGRGVVSNNYLANPANTKHCWQFHAPIQGNGGVVSTDYTEKVVVSDNSCVGGVTDWVLFVGPQNTSEDERLRDLIIERNYVRAGTGGSVGIAMRGSVSSTTVRNNVINMSATADNYVYGISFSGDGVGPVITGIENYNNTYYDSGTRPESIAFIIGATATNITLKNNLSYAPSATDGLFRSGTGSSGLVESNNSSNAQTEGTSPSFSSIPTTATQLSSSDFKVSGGSYAIDAGAYIAGVYRDLQDVVRTLPNDLGAVQA